MSEPHPVHENEAEAPTGRFEWAGILGFAWEDGEPEKTIDEVHAIRESGAYYRTVVLKHEDREDSSVIGDEPGEFDRVGSTGTIDWEATEDSDRIEYLRIVYANPTGDRWAVYEPVVDVDDENDMENPYLTEEVREQILDGAVNYEVFLATTDVGTERHYRCPDCEAHALVAEEIDHEAECEVQYVE